MKQFFKRADTLLWLVGTQAIAVGLDTLLVNLGLFNLDPQITVLIGLVISQMTKELRERIVEKQKILDDSAFED